MGLRVQLFGPFQLWRDDQPIPPGDWKSEKAQALLKILLTDPGRTFTHDQFIDWLWPEADPDKAQKSLRPLITRVRRILEPELKRGPQSQYIFTRPSGYCFNPEADCIIDSEVCKKHLQQAHQLESKDQFERVIQEYEQAVALYQGEFLAEDRYADWAISHTERWQGIYLDTLSQLAECHARLAQYRRAIARCNQILEIEPYREDTYRQLMLYYYLAGDPERAVQIYERYRTRLRDDLETEPLPETQELYQQIVDRDIPGIDEVYQPVSVVERSPVPALLSRIPFIGREAEYAALVNHVEEVATGAGRMIFVYGEAGIGKTRLIQEFIHYAHHHYQTRSLRGRCHEMGMGLPYQPLIDAIRGELSRLDPQVIDIQPLWLAEVADLVPELHDLIPDLPDNPSLPPELKRNRLFEGTTQFLIGLAQTGKPLVLFLDDLHWVDPSTFDFLNYLLPRIRQEPILVVGAFRSEEVADVDHPLIRLMQEGERQELLHRIELPRLSYEAVHQLLVEMSSALSEPFCERIYQETEGNPFFIVAVLQNLFAEGALRIVEAGRWISDIDDITTNYRELMIPKQIKDVIRRRVARLGEAEQQLLKLVAVIGRRSEFDLIQQAWGGEPETFLDPVERVTDAQLLVESEQGYEFSHDKVREVIYNEEISAPRRRLLHGTVAETIEALYQDNIEEHGEELAYHYQRSGDLEKALHYLILAGDKATALYAYQEAGEYYQNALEVLDQLPHTLEHLRRGIDLRLKWVNASYYSEPEKNLKILERARQMAEEIEDPDRMARTHDVMGRMYYLQGDQAAAVDQANKILGMAEVIADEALMTFPYKVLGIALHYRKEYPQAIDHLQRGIALIERLGEAVLDYISEDVAHFYGMLGITYAEIGDFDRGFHYVEKAIEIAQRVNDLYRLGLEYAFLMKVFMEKGAYRRALELSPKALELSQRWGNEFSIALIHGGKGICHTRIGEYREGMPHLQKGIQMERDLGITLQLGLGIAELGHAYLGIGELDSALDCCREALELAHNTGNRYEAGIAERYLGQAYAKQAKWNEASQHVKRSTELLEAIGARPELSRSLLSLGLIYQQQGKPDRYRRHLSRAIEMFNGMGIEWELTWAEEYLDLDDR